VLSPSTNNHNVSNQTFSKESGKGHDPHSSYAEMPVLLGTSNPKSVDGADPQESLEILSNLADASSKIIELHDRDEVENFLNDFGEAELLLAEDKGVPVSSKCPLSPSPRDDEYLESRKRTRTYTRQVPCYQSTSQDMNVGSVYLVNNARKRTMVVHVAEGLENPETRAAMDAEIASFRTMGCVEDVLIGNVPKGANPVTARWVFAINNKENGTKRYKERLVAGGFEDNKKNRVTRDSPTAATSS
jgi:hypothetical protein